MPERMFSVAQSGWLAVCLWLLLGGSTFAAAFNPTPEALEKNRQANLKCLACHSEAALRQPPKADLDLKKLRGLIVDPAAFAASSHARLACGKCHTEGYAEHPHAEDAKDMTSTCDDCHSKQARVIEAEFEQSVHADNLTEPMTCLTCHNPHRMQAAKNLKQPDLIVAQDNRVCLGCHDSDATFAQYAPEKKTRPLTDDAHAWLPNARMHWKSVRCVECHTPSNPNTQSHQILSKDKAVKDCVACHSRDSLLSARLYRHLAEEDQRKYGFINSAILGKPYVVGATRNPLLDGIVIALVVLTLVGMLAHGLVRYLAARLRRRKQHD